MTTTTAAGAVGAFLAERGVARAYGICGGHIQPIWDEVARHGVRIVDVRHEFSAVAMAHAEAELTGRLGVVLVTAGPGLTNAITGIANAERCRVPLLVIAGRAPRPQHGMNALQDVPQAEIVAPLCRSSEDLADRRHVLARLDAAVATALGEDGVPGPVYLGFPTDLQREHALVLDADRLRMRPRPRRRRVPDPEEVGRAAGLLRAARRPVVLSGSGARGSREQLEAFLEATGALYLDTPESRGLLPIGRPEDAAPLRTRVMADADLVVTLGRQLDFQIAFGSEVAFGSEPKLVRIGRTASETTDNRRADATLLADADLALAALSAEDVAPRDPDTSWREEVLAACAERRDALARRLATPEVCGDGLMHPFTLVGAVNRFVEDDSIVIADGGDILSFGRIGLKAPEYLESGVFGCIGVGVPFAVGAALAHPGRRVVALIGDGSIGFTAIDIDTAVRSGAKVVFVVANNAGWNIERHDQLIAYEGRLVGVELPGCRYDLLGASLGAHPEHVTEVAELGPALERAFANAPAVVDVAVSREPISSDYKSGLATVPDLHVLTAWDAAERRLAETGS